MNFFERYRAYLADNPQRYWFKRKIFGWGWTPATWQGWSLLAAFMVVYVWIFVPFVTGPEPTDSEVAQFVLEIFIWGIVLVAACWATGEPPKWQWGIPKERRD